MSLVLDKAAALRPPVLPTWLLHRAPLALGVLLALALYQWAPQKLGAYQERVLLDISVAIVLAVSLNIVNGYTGQFSIGHGGFLAIGGYVAGTVTYYGSLVLWGDAALRGGFLGVGQWLFVLGGLCGGLAAAGAGYLVGLPSLRLRGDYLAIVTLGFGEIVRVLLELSNSQLFDAQELHDATWRQLVPPPWGGAQGFSDIPKYTSLFWAYVAVAVMLIFAYRLKQSSTGRALLSIREDEVAAQAMGVNITQLKVRAFVFAAFFAGVGGAIYAHQSGTILRPLDAGFQRSFDVIIIVVLGGMGSISGATLAAILLTVAGEWLREPTHIWYLAIYVGLARVAFTPGGGWWKLALIAASAVVLEAARGLAGPLVAFQLGNVPVQVYELLYLALLIALVVMRREARRGVLVVFAIIAAIEIVRALAIRRGIALGDYRMIIYALLLISMMIFRPQGLFGVHEFWDYLPRASRAKRGADA